MPETQTNILMVGPSGVGKTSLLTAMSERMAAEAALIGCNFFARGNTGTTLLKKRDQLRALVEKGGILPAENESLDGDRERTDYIFDVDVDPKAQNGPEFSLRLTDVPGGWFTGDGAPDGLLQDSHLSFIVVDTNALLEQPRKKDRYGRFHHTINRPDLVTNFYKRELGRGRSQTNGQPHFVVFVLVRAESYMDKVVRREEMRRALIESYKDLLDLFAIYGIRSKASVIKTIGGIRFNHFEEVEPPGGGDRIPVARFMALKEVGYKPELCDVPLKLALCHGAETRQNGTDFVDTMLDLLGWGIKPRLRDFAGKVLSNLNSDWVIDLQPL